jgi:hypothetical protein
MNQRLKMAANGGRLLAAAFSPLPLKRPKFQTPGSSHRQRMWKLPPWLDDPSLVGIPLDVDRLEGLRLSWLLAHPDREAEFADGSFQDENGTHSLPASSHQGIAWRTPFGAMRLGLAYLATCVKGIIPRIWTRLSDSKGLRRHFHPSLPTPPPTPYYTL